MDVPMTPPRWPSVVTTIVLVLALVGCGSDGQADVVVQITSPATTSTPSTTASSTTEAAAADGEPLSARDDGRLRVLIVGDSLVFAAVPVFDAVLGSHGVEVRYVGFSATGLLSGQGWWNREISAQVEAWHPDVVVIEACCNYANGEPEYVDDSGQAVAADSEQMYVEWEAMAADAVDRADDGGAHVMWVRTPCLAGGELATRVDRFNLIVDALGVERVDWAGALCPGGVYTASMDVGGDVVEVRADDGLHLTDAGDTVVAEVTWSAIAAWLDAPSDS